MNSTATASNVEIARNTAILLAGQVATQVLSFVIGTVVAKALGAIEYGRYIAAFALAALFGSFFNMGLDKLLTREMARRPEDGSDLFRDTATARVVIAFGVYTVLAVAIRALRLQPDQRMMALLAGLVTLASSLADFLRSVFQAFERMEYDVATRLLERLLTLLMLPLVLYQPMAESTVLGMLLASVMALGVTLVLTRQFIRPRRPFEWKPALAVLQKAIPFGIMTTTLAVMERLDAFWVALAGTDAEIGWYGLAMNLLFPFTLVPLAFSTSLFAHLSRISPRDAELSKVIGQTSLRWVLVIGLATTITLASLADCIVLLIFGSEFAGAVIPLRILAISLVLLYSRIALSSVLGAIGCQNWVAIVVVIQLVLTVILSFVLIPITGIVGAAVTVVGRELFGFLALVYIALREKALRSPQRLICSISLAGVAMYCTMQRLHVLGPARALLGGLGVYTAALVVTGGINRTDWTLIRSSLSPMCIHKESDQWRASSEK